MATKTLVTILTKGFTRECISTSTPPSDSASVGLHPPFAAIAASVDFRDEGNYERN